MTLITPEQRIESLERQMRDLIERVNQLNAAQGKTTNLYKQRSPEGVIAALQKYLDDYWNSTDALIPYGLLKSSFHTRLSAINMTLEDALKQTVYKIGTLKGSGGNRRIIYPPEAIGSHGDKFERSVKPDADFFDDLTSEGPFANPEE